MIKSRFAKIYINNKLNPALGLRTSGQSGVYIIKSGAQVVYVGYSATNLYKTMTRHFQSWEDRQVRTVYNNRNSENLTARVIFCAPMKAKKLETALVIKYRPRDNNNKYNQYILDLSDKKLIYELDESKTVNFNDTAPPF
jgi:hypothetical protein